MQATRLNKTNQNIFIKQTKSVWAKIVFKMIKELREAG
jgi:hypothetical protein